MTRGESFSLPIELGRKILAGSLLRTAIVSAGSLPTFATDPGDWTTLQESPTRCCVNVVVAVVSVASCMRLSTLCDDARFRQTDGGDFGSANVVDDVTDGELAADVSSEMGFSDSLAELRRSYPAAATGASSWSLASWTSLVRIPSSRSWLRYSEFSESESGGVSRRTSWRPDPEVSKSFSS